MSETSRRLREIADRIEEEYKNETISFDSQNLNSKNVEPYIVERCDGSQNDISVRGERLSHDKITIQARWIVEGGRGKGIFQTTDGKFFRLRGRVGDEWETASLRFEELDMGGVVAAIQKSVQRG